MENFLHSKGMRHFAAVLWLASGTGYALAASAVDDAQKRYRQADFAGAAEVLKPVAAGNPAACELLGQSYLMLGEYSKATEFLEKAAALNPNQSFYYLWLGRAYGRRAEVSFPLAAPRYAAKARVNLEKALELDPGNSDVTDDLFEFYLQAPGFLGGGFDKAAVMANKIAERDPAEGVFAKARLAEERNDLSTAEAMLRRAVELAPKQPRRLLDLAVFLSKHGRFEESDAEFKRARQFAPEAPRVLFREASTYIKQNRNSGEARDLLRQYISSSAIGPDDPSKQDAMKLLKKVSGI